MSAGGNPDLAALLAQAQQLQERMVAARDQLAQTHVSGSAAGGLVNATVSGTGDLVAVSIQPQACDPTDTDTLGDLVVAAVRNAKENADRLAAEQLGPLAGGLEGLGGPDLAGPAPGGGLPTGF